MMEQLQNRTILQGQVLEQLAKIPSQSIQCMVTSPPYYDARDYGIDGQWGKEKDVGMYLEHLAQFMKSIWRVMRNDGIAWVNIGDSIVNEGWYGFPEFFFTNCRKAGWRSVSKPIWFKRNAMPLSTKKRLSPKYEPVYGFAKSDDYYFDLKSIKIPVLTELKPFNLRVREAKKEKLDKKYGSKYTASEDEKNSHDKLGVRKQDMVKKGHYTGFNGRYDHAKVLEEGKNPGDIFEYEDLDLIIDITVKPYPEYHYATFPEKLPELFIKCSTKENDWVLDPFFGAGTVGLVAENLKRNWIGIELKQEYIDLAKKRIGI